jgi:hypothetical protein
LGNVAQPPSSDINNSTRIVNRFSSIGPNSSRDGSINIRVDLKGMAAS